VNDEKAVVSKLAVDVARGVYADKAEMFQRDLNNAIQGAASRVSNVNGWAQEQLRIMADMAHERDIQWVVSMANKLRKGLANP